MQGSFVESLRERPARCTLLGSALAQGVGFGVLNSFQEKRRGRGLPSSLTFIAVYTLSKRVVCPWWVKRNCINTPLCTCMHTMRIPSNYRSCPPKLPFPGKPLKHDDRLLCPFCLFTCVFPPRMLECQVGKAASVSGLGFQNLQVRIPQQFFVGQLATTAGCMCNVQQGPEGIRRRLLTRSK